MSVIAFEREVRFGDVTYPFHVHAGQQSWAELTKVLASFGADRFLVVTDDGIPRQHVAEVLGHLEPIAPTNVVSIPDSEKSKNIETLDTVAEQAVQAGVTRKSIVVALGGGLVGNVAGLLAALMFRGIRLVHLPTTLLAMSDSVLSLKQAVNSRLGKNHIGTFHEPILVWNHLDFLDTLPPDEIRAALCEMVKNVIGICPDEFDRVASLLRVDARYSPATMAEFIDLCVRAKTAVMRNDHREKREALVLEYGHTVGHAAELLTGGSFRHGYAIGVGMLVAAKVSRSLGTMPAEDEQAHRVLLERNGAPTTLPDSVSLHDILEVVRRDNKRGYIPHRIGAVDMILLDGLGRPHWNGDNIVTQVDEAVLSAAVSEYLPFG